MHIWRMDQILWVAGDVGKILLLAILLARGLHRKFPVFLSYILWDLISDFFAIWVLLSHNGYFSRIYGTVYYSASTVTYLLQIVIVLEIAREVFSPAANVLSRRLLSWFFAVILIVGCGAFFFARWINPAPFVGLRAFLVANTTAATLCLITFVLIAGFAQVLGITWKNHVLQLATGLAFYAVMALVGQIMLSQLHAGPSYASHYRFWSRFEVISYLGTVFFWCYAFLKQEAPRKEFSPQMQKILVQLSGNAKRQTAVLARSREP